VRDLSKGVGKGRESERHIWRKVKRSRTSWEKKGATTTITHKMMKEPGGRLRGQQNDAWEKGRRGVEG